VANHQRDDGGDVDTYLLGLLHGAGSQHVTIINLPKKLTRMPLKRDPSCHAVESLGFLVRGAGKQLNVYCKRIGMPLKEISL